MEFKLYPQPVDDLCTPFVYLSQEKSYFRYYYTDTISLNLISISLVNETNLPHVQVSGINREMVIGKRQSNRRKIKDYFHCCQSMNHNFLNYFDTTFVIPSFTLSDEEALIKTIIRQVITAKQAKRMFSNFIKEFGEQKEGLYSFPSFAKLEKITVDDLKTFGLAFKATRICSGINRLLTEKKKEITSMNGIGPWSKAILQVEKNKDFSFYPFGDKSGEKIKKEFGIDLIQIAENDKELAGDLYIYAVSYLESKK